MLSLSASLCCSHNKKIAGRAEQMNKAVALMALFFLAVRVLSDSGAQRFAQCVGFHAPIRCKHGPPHM